MIGFVERRVSQALRTNNDDRFTARKIFYKLITERLDKGWHVIHPSGLINAGHLQLEEGGDSSR